MTGSDSIEEWQNPQRFTIGDRSPALAVIESVAQYKGKEPLSLPPLINYIHPEALDQMVAGEMEAVVQFEYDGVKVKLASSGEITVAERAE